MVALIVNAQDPTFSSFQLQKLELSPAYGGSGGPGKVFISNATRTSYYPTRGPFRYHSGALDISPCKVGNLGLGFLFNQELQGDGYYKKTRVGANLGYSVFLKKAGKPNKGKYSKYDIRNFGAKYNMTLSFGMRTSVVTQSIDWNELTFSDELHPINGIVYPSINKGIPLDLSNAINWDAGIKLSMAPQKGNLIMLGFSAFNIFEPKIGLLSQGLLERRLSFIGSWIINERNITYKINGRFELQNRNNFLALNTELIINKSLRIAPGLRMPVFNKNTYRNTLYPSIMIGYQFSPIFMSYVSYENNVMGEIIRGKTSSFEIGIVLNTESTFCDKNNKFKELFKYNSKNISTPIGCPSMGNLQGKIESF